MVITETGYTTDPNNNCNGGTVGDGITSATILTLTGTAEANSTVNVFERHQAARHGDGERQRGLELHHRHSGERYPQPHGQGDRCGGQYQRGLRGPEYDGGYGGADRAGHYLVLAR